jgi:diphthamide synthase (EF-2-diphthine--ammonia ligase)
MAAACQRAVADGIQAIAFGDLFLEDVRAYRVDRLKGTGLEPLFPLWGIPTAELARTMIAAGLRARLSCVDTRQLPASFAGREFDSSLLDELPPQADPCAERGEFHSCAYAGPMFSSPLALELGEIVNRDGFVFADLLLAASDGLNKPAA